MFSTTLLVQYWQTRRNPHNKANNPNNCTLDTQEENTEWLLASPLIARAKRAGLETLGVVTMILSLTRVQRKEEMTAPAWSVVDAKTLPSLSLSLSAQVRAVHSWSGGPSECERGAKRV